MVSWISTFVAVCALSAGVFSFPVIEEHQEIGLPETVVGHEEIFNHQIGLSQELLEPKLLEHKVLEPKIIEPQIIEPKIIEPKIIETKIIEPKLIGEPKHATSYQSFHLEGKHAVPVVIKTIHPTPVKHFSGVQESFGHEISEIEPIDLKLHGI